MIALLAESAGVMPANAGSADLSQVMIDVSSHNDLTALLGDVPNRKIELVVARVSIGLGTPDGAYEKNMQLLRSAAPQILRGAYHALYATSSGKAQAAEFLGHVRGACRPGEKILLAVDWERPQLKKKMVDAAPTATLREFVDQVLASTGHQPVVYTDPIVISANRDTLAGWANPPPLWLATYYAKIWRSRDCHKQPEGQNGFTCSNSIHGLVFPDVNDFSPWSDWVFWQFSAATPGNPEYLLRKFKDMPVDVSYFGGSREEFRAFFEANAVKCEAIVVPQLTVSR
jgi:GH25 family lysozyme M1 (1,4-beta-N-acetylmuramidase)